MHTIRTITIDAQNVFDPENPDESGIVGTWGNKIHVITREEVVRKELLFKEGDVYNWKIIQESERNLRKRSFFAEVSIESHYNADEKGVDIVVHTRDQWSLIVGATFGGTSENSSAGLDFGDKNFLGMGQSVNYSFRTGSTGYTHNYGFRDANLFGSRYDLRLEHNLKPAEYVYNANLERPFYSLSTTEAHGVGYSRTVHAEPGINWNSWRSTVYYGEALVLEDSVLRAYFRFSFGEEVSFGSTGSSAIVRDNKVAISADFLDHPHDYSEERYIDKFRLVEDIPLGATYTLLIGPRLEAFGSTTSDISASAAASKWHQVFEHDYLFTSLALARNDDYFNDIYADFMARYYLRRFESQNIVTRFQLSYSESATNRFRLGGTNGLRGYKVDEFIGKNQMVINVEDRIFTYQTLLSGIIEPGFVLFTDWGNAWNNTPDDVLTQLYGSFGAGLRLALVKAPGVSLIRVDLGIPMDTRRPWVITVGMEGFF